MEENTKKHKSTQSHLISLLTEIPPFTIDNAPRFKTATLISQHSLQLSGRPYTSNLLNDSFRKNPEKRIMFILPSVFSSPCFCSSVRAGVYQLFLSRR